MPLFLDIYSKYRYSYKYNMEVDEEKIDTYLQYFGWVLLVVLSATCGLEAWMHWSWIDVILLGYKSVEELYPSPPLGVDSADTSRLPKEKKAALY
jgi:hypothetical protein